MSSSRFKLYKQIAFPFLLTAIEVAYVTDPDAQPTNYKLQIANYKLQITNYKLQITDYKLQNGI